LPKLAHEAAVPLIDARLSHQAEDCQRRAIEADAGLRRAQLAYARTLAVRGAVADAVQHMRLSLSGQ